MDINTKLANQRGQIPDQYWYQLNGKSAQENYNEIILARQRQFEDETEIIIRSEVKVK